METKTSLNAGPDKTLKMTIFVEREMTLGEAKAAAKNIMGRLPTLSEFICALKSDQELYDKAAGHWYWLAGDSEADGVSLAFIPRKNWDKVQTGVSPTQEFPRGNVAGVAIVYDLEGALKEMQVKIDKLKRAMRK